MRERGTLSPGRTGLRGGAGLLSPRAGVGATVVLLAVVVLTALRVQVPADLGTWAPAALPGEAVFVLEPTEDGLLAGTGQGLTVLGADGDVRRLAVEHRVDAVAPEAEGLLVGTSEGLLDVPLSGAPSRTVAFRGVAVHRLSNRGGELWAGTASGLHRRSADGRWQRSWPESSRPDQGVPAVLALDDAVLFAHPEGLALLDRATGTVDVVHRGVRVVSLSTQPGAGGAERLWAGLFGPPLLLLSVDGGRSWEPRSRGLGFVAVNTVVRDPSVPGRLLAGGSGIADGEGNAGTQTSDDLGRTWQVEQGRLSNTHVFALSSGREAVALTVRLAGLPGSAQLPLPLETGRVHAGTNGGGIYSSRPPVPLLRVPASALAVLRLLEPLLAGLVLLLCVAPAFRRLQRAGPRRRAPGRSPRPTSPPPTSPPPTSPDHTHDEHRHEETA